MIRSFEILFPLMLPGGTYVIEDISWHFSNDGREVTGIQPHPDVPSVPMFQYFTRLIAAKAAHVTTLSSVSDEENGLYRSIDNITVVGGAILIRKKARRNLEGYIAAFESELRARSADRGGSPDVHVATRYAEYLITYGYNLERAVKLLEEVIVVDPDNKLARKLLYKGLTSLGKLEEAATVESYLASLGDDVSVPATYVPEQMQFPH
jgi:hypothetical protein